MNVFDVVIPAVIFIAGIRGFYMGFVLTLVGLIGTLANWYLSLRFYPYILDVLYTSEPLVESVAGLASKAPAPDMAAFVVLSLISFALTYLLINLAIKFIISLVNGIAKLPLLRGINKLGGLIAGLAEGFFLICFVFLILYISKGILSAGFITAVEGSSLGAWFFNSNPFFYWIPANLYIWREIIL